ncbi:MAG: TonB-dependent receptor [Rubrivivax sp.]|nr:TonB-dependent receptor [Rubrivivax sp.]
MFPGSTGRRLRPHASFAGAALSVLSLAAAAQLPAPPAQTVVVTATRSPLPLSQVLADMSVLERDAIERSGASCIADLLVRLPGIELSRNGGPGTVTSVFVRGGEARHTAVYIDGVRVDAQGTGGATWEQIPIDQVERIEVLRGPAAAIYGSDAVAGVVQVITRKGSGAPQASFAVTLGSRATRQLQAGVSGSSGALDYALSASHARSNGFNARLTANPDVDGWKRSTLQARAGWQLTPGQRLEGGLLTSKLEGRYDGFGSADDISDYGLRTATLGWSSRWRAGSETRVNVGESVSTYETNPSYYRTETTLRNTVLRHEETLAGQHLSLTLERRDDHLLNPATAFAATLEGQRTQDALALGWRTDIGQHGLQAHVRHDDDSEFGGKTTGSLAWGWRFQPGWRASVSAATSFRAPTLYQRFSEYGVATLAPESGRNLEMALRWQGEGSEASATVWRNRLRDLIAFGGAGPCLSPFGCYENVGRSRYEGLTLAGRHTLGGVALHGSLSWHDPRNLDIDKVLVRRARRLATFGAQTTLDDGWTVGAEMQASGSRFDNTANTQRMGGYALVNLSLERQLSPGLVLQGRLDNAGDKVYEVARTYATPGRSALLSLRWTLR